MPQITWEGMACPVQSLMASAVKRGSRSTAAKYRETPELNGRCLALRLRQTIGTASQYRHGRSNCGAWHGNTRQILIKPLTDIAMESGVLWTANACSSALDSRFRRFIKVPTSTRDNSIFPNCNCSDLRSPHVTSSFTIWPYYAAILIQSWIETTFF